VADLAALVKGAGGVLVVDAVQAAGRLPLDVSVACGDFLILSAHKIGGPKGVGAFVSASGLLMPAPLVRGGGQEKGHRAGTENLPGIAGFGAAAQVAASTVVRMGEVGARRDAAEAALRDLAPDLVVHGADAGRLANTLLFTVPGLKAETALIALDLAGVSVSTGSACSSGKVAASHVLEAMGVASGEGALRVSLGVETGEAEIGRLVAAMRVLLARRDGARVASAA
jgi:cysteine desulfurase